MKLLFLSYALIVGIILTGCNADIYNIDDNTPNNHLDEALLNNTSNDYLSESSIPLNETESSFPVEDIQAPDKTIDYESNIEEKEEDNQEQQTSIEYGRPENWPSHIQDFVPGSIRLFDNDYFSSISPNPERRIIFYKIDGRIIDLVPREEWVEFRDTVFYVEQNLDTMDLVRFIQYFDIDREILEMVIQQMFESKVEMVKELSNIANANGRQTYDPFSDLDHEVNELPNLDIIFTFDDEIINWFYRRQ